MRRNPLGRMRGGNGRFIPWDDDFDLCIFEEDYDRAVDCLIDGLQGETVLQCEKTEPNYFHGWIKVRDKHSHVYPDIPTLKENGVWIDIYKLVRTYENEVSLKIYQEIWNYLNRRLDKKGITKSEFDRRISEWNLQEKLEKSLAESAKAKQGDTVYVIMSASKVVLREEWILPLKKIIFEGINVTTFHEVEKYLIQHYGQDYMVYPPDDMRRIGISRLEIC